MRGGRDGKGIVSTMKKVEFEFDNLDVLDMQANAHQIITKKKHFPKGIIGVINRAERIDFS